MLGIEEEFNWRGAMLFPASAFLKLAITWFCLPNEHLDTQAEEKEVERSLQEQESASGYRS